MSGGRKSTSASPPKTCASSARRSGPWFACGVDCLNFREVQREIAVGVHAMWLLERFGVDAGLIGDVAEEYGLGRSHAWLWCQTMSALIHRATTDVRTHTLLAERAVVVGCVAAAMIGRFERVVIPTLGRNWAWKTELWLNDHLGFPVTPPAIVIAATMGAAIIGDRGACASAAIDVDVARLRPRSPGSRHRWVRQFVPTWLVYVWRILRADHQFAVSVRSESGSHDRGWTDEPSEIEPRKTPDWRIAATRTMNLNPARPLWLIPTSARST